MKLLGRRSDSAAGTGAPQGQSYGQPSQQPSYSQPQYGQPQSPAYTQPSVCTTAGAVSGTGHARRRSGRSAVLTGGAIRDACRTDHGANPVGG